MDEAWLKSMADAGAFGLLAWLFVWTFKNTIPQQQAGFLKSLETQQAAFAAQLERQEREFTAALSELRSELGRDRNAFEARMDGMTRSLERLTLALIMRGQVGAPKDEGRRFGRATGLGHTGPVGPEGGEG